MTAVTFSPKLAPATAAAPAKTGKGFWARVLDRIVEARMAQVEREIRMHLHTLPRNTLEQAGYFARQSNDRELPFVK